MEIFSNYFNVQVSKPINSLLCTNLFPLLGKLLLKIMVKNGIILYMKFGFCPKHSTISMMEFIVQQILYSMALEKNNTVVPAMFLDIK